MSFQFKGRVPRPKSAALSAETLSELQGQITALSARIGQLTASRSEPIETRCDPDGIRRAVARAAAMGAELPDGLADQYIARGLTLSTAHAELFDRVTAPARAAMAEDLWSGVIASRHPEASAETPEPAATDDPLDPWAAIVDRHQVGQRATAEQLAEQRLATARRDMGLMH